MANRLLLVGWDAADWKILHPLIDAGEMPALRRIVEEGASGPLFCNQPVVPVPQWVTIATGKRPWQHRVCHPMENIPGAGQAVAVTAARRRSLALWEMLAQAGKRTMVMGWPATHGEQTENAVIVSDWYGHPTAGPGVKPWPPAWPGTYWPKMIGTKLDGLRISPEDVQADFISHYIPDWKKVDQQRDRRIGQLRLYLATDFSCQVALMTLLAGQEWDFATVRFPALGAISQLFLPYRLPRPDWISETEFRLYQNAIPGACRILDQMLSKLLAAAGSDTSVIVVSPYGVNQQAEVSTGNNEAWKSSHGIIAASGPGFASDTLVCGATVLDVAPTILTWFGLPIGDDMEGRVLLEGFVKAPEVARVPTWEATPAPSKQEPIPSDSSQGAATLRRESDWNLAQSYLDAGRHEEALPILEGLFRAFPERMETGHLLFQCQLALKKLPEAVETLEVVLEGIPAGVWSLVPRAELCLACGQIKEARSLVNEAQELRPTHPDALRKIGLLLLRLREWDALADLANQALKLDDNDSLAWLGLAEAQLRKRLAAEAEASGRRAIGLNYYMPEAHFVVARALIAQGKWSQARETMQVLLQLQPDNRVAATYARRLEAGAS